MYEHKSNSRPKEIKVDVNKLLLVAKYLLPLFLFPIFFVAVGCILSELNTDTYIKNKFYSEGWFVFYSIGFIICLLTYVGVFLIRKLIG